MGGFWWYGMVSVVWEGFVGMGGVWWYGRGFGGVGGGWIVLVRDI